MSKMVKLITLAAITLGFSAVTTIPAHALSVIAPAYAGQAQAQGETYGNTPVAFSGGAAASASASSIALSAEEIQHVTWCATRYQSYHATDNTYETKRGARAECDSPY